MANSNIGNNIIYTKKSGATGKVSVETILLGSERVDLGVNTGNKEIATDPDSGYKYERNEVVGKTVHNLQTQKRSRFFILDLETGKRGWYPGAIQVGDIAGTNVEIKASKDESSETIIVVSNVTVKIEDLEYDDDKNIWYKVNYNDYVGYVRNTYISNVRYTDPY